MFRPYDYIILFNYVVPLNFLWRKREEVWGVSGWYWHVGITYLHLTQAQSNCGLVQKEGKLTVF